MLHLVYTFSRNDEIEFKHLFIYTECCTASHRDTQLTIITTKRTNKHQITFSKICFFFLEILHF